MTFYYLCSMGANIAPEINFAAARDYLSKLGQAYYSRAFYTQPVAMDSDKEFLNALFVLTSELDHASLKQQFNTIEKQLGRDRDDPLSAHKDRPMDIDILGTLTSEQVWLQVPEYLRNAIPSIRPIAEQLLQR